MKFLFFLSQKYSISVILPLIKELDRLRQDWAITASFSADAQFPEDRMLNSSREYLAYQPDFVLTPGNFLDYRLSGLKVQIFHGLGIEKPAHYKIRHFFDIYCTSGPVVTARFIELQKKYPYFLVRETGWTKIDYILNYKSSGQLYPDQTEYSRVILYAPTCSSSMHSAEKLLPEIIRIARPEELWIFKFHDLLQSDQILKKLPDNIRIFDNSDITPVLHHADLLISDTSSVVYEFMVLDKPVITFRTLDRLDKGINITEPHQLRSAIDRSLENPNEFYENRKKHLQEVNPYLNGEISKQMINELMNIKLSGWKSGRKPLNLWRKWQVRQRVKKW
ncbi:MAG: CDP-glycerol glycerophosphotransferase family protein [Candidatus Cloacimonetes bacterium]|nr:CDP-glycerol glycerophosphotransferase family protein [Candidatus Cloacimonadota bacterium]